MTEDEAAQIIGHYAGNLPTHAAYEAEDFLTPRLRTAVSACVATLTGDASRETGAPVVLRLDDDGSVSYLELRDGVPTETFCGALSGGRLTQRQSVIRSGDGNTFPNESLRFEHPLATLTIDRTVVASDNVVPLIDALKGFCGGG